MPKKRKIFRISGHSEPGLPHKTVLKFRNTENRAGCAEEFAGFGMQPRSLRKKRPCFTFPANKPAFVNHDLFPARTGLLENTNAIGFFPLVYTPTPVFIFSLQKKYCTNAERNPAGAGCGPIGSYLLFYFFLECPASEVGIILKGAFFTCFTTAPQRMHWAQTRTVLWVPFAVVIRTDWRFG